jgi:uncharacterized protein YneF (UPF0154 family)
MKFYTATAIALTLILFFYATLQCLNVSGDVNDKYTLFIFPNQIEKPTYKNSKKINQAPIRKILKFIGAKPSSNHYKNKCNYGHVY